ncbi:MAG: hypothetical protein ABF420_11195 [Acetobacter syzygii]
MNEDPKPATSDLPDSQASWSAGSAPKNNPAREAIVEAAKAEMQARAKRLGYFEWAFFVYSLVLCTYLLVSLSKLSKLYFKGHLLEKLGDYRDWHLLFASDAIFAGMTLVFMTVFLSALKMVSNNSEKLRKDSIEAISGDPNGKSSDNSDCFPSYFHNIICCLKDLLSAIKGFPK